MSLKHHSILLGALLLAKFVTACAGPTEVPPPGGQGSSIATVQLDEDVSEATRSHLRRLYSLAGDSPIQDVVTLAVPAAATPALVFATNEAGQPVLLTVASAGQPSTLGVRSTALAIARVFVLPPFLPKGDPHQVDAQLAGSPSFDQLVSAISDLADRGESFITSNDVANLVTAVLTDPGISGVRHTLPSMAVSTSTDCGVGGMSPDEFRQVGTLEMNVTKYPGTPPQAFEIANCTYLSWLVVNSDASGAPIGNPATIKRTVGGIPEAFNGPGTSFGGGIVAGKEGANGLLFLQTDDTNREHVFQMGADVVSVFLTLYGAYGGNVPAALASKVASKVYSNDFIAGLASKSGLDLVEALIDQALANRAVVRAELTTYLGKEAMEGGASQAGFGVLWSFGAKLYKLVKASFAAGGTAASDWPLFRDFARYRNGSAGVAVCQQGNALAPEEMCFGPAEWSGLYLGEICAAQSYLRDLSTCDAAGVVVSTRPEDAEPGQMRIDIHLVYPAYRQAEQTFDINGCTGLIPARAQPGSFSCDASYTYNGWTEGVVTLSQDAGGIRSLRLEGERPLDYAQILLGHATIDDPRDHYSGNLIDCRVTSTPC